eukprot:TRINITY_DN2744_c0_g1::TRINITY_DN2744_c0_g1_i1::g.27465::m.27465 TRINITY_DN2744_c0_g1::TRINITY_DN2744_c0_g1_i1::g.27465  ORF type:complete len:409 (+),score=7.94,zf-CCHC/PF00098.18/9.6e-05,MSP1_C/PF07462.6/0.0032,MSP1_C/PF07462.6/2.5e+03,zf-CCHC_5/PF14787.1/0.073,zf-CCHC_4/PF14392.1/0.66,zf-CCHC_3/PF13917.1/6.9e+03,zf-CCHC_3/PF13917.1/0.42 TRINITY_DN2744_c0_g1_i1:131-1357(+)
MRNGTRFFPEKRKWNRDEPSPFRSWWGSSEGGRSAQSLDDFKALLSQKQLELRDLLELVVEPCDHWTLLELVENFVCPDEYLGKRVPDTVSCWLSEAMDLEDASFPDKRQLKLIYRLVKHVIALVQYETAKAVTEKVRALHAKRTRIRFNHVSGSASKETVTDFPESVKMDAATATDQNGLFDSKDISVNTDDIIVLEKRAETADVAVNTKDGADADEHVQASGSRSENEHNRPKPDKVKRFRPSQKKRSSEHRSDSASGSESVSMKVEQVTSTSASNKQDKKLSTYERYKKRKSHEKDRYEYRAFGKDFHTDSSSSCSSGYGYRYGACFKCGKQGHWKRECHEHKAEHQKPRFEPQAPILSNGTDVEQVIQIVLQVLLALQGNGGQGMGYGKSPKLPRMNRPGSGWG